MTNPTADIEAALTTLTVMQKAAPPVAAGKLADVIGVLNALRDENAYLYSRWLEATAAPAGSEWDASSAPPRKTGALGTGRLSDGGPNTSALGDRADANGYVSPEAYEAAYEEAFAFVQAEREDGQINASIPDPDALMPQTQMALQPILMQVRENAESLGDGAYGELSSDQTAVTREIRDHADGMLNMIDSLGQLRLIRRGLMLPNPAAVDAHIIMGEAQRISQRRAVERGHQLSIQAGETLPNIYADRKSVLTILLDLLDNSIRYTTRNGIIRMNAISLGTHVLFTVEDDGIGLSEADMTHVATPFWRALHQPLVRGSAGSGLRLYLAKQILALQGGELVFSGEPGEGSSFSMTLPVAEG